MKLTFSLTVLLLSIVASNAQSRPVYAMEYKSVFDSAVSQTNRAFPFTFTVTAEFFKNGKIVRSESEIEERESQGYERKKKTFVNGGKTATLFQINNGFGEVYCSLDGVSWKPPTPYECHLPGDNFLELYTERTPVSVEYSVSEKTLEGKPVKVYRKYSVFKADKPTGKKEFAEQIATIDSNGFLIDVLDTDGTLDPQTVTKKMKETWDTTTKFKPVVAPIKK